MGSNKYIITKIKCWPDKTHSYLRPGHREVAHGVRLLQLPAHHLAHYLDLGPLAQLGRVILTAPTVTSVILTAPTVTSVILTRHYFELVWFRGNHGKVVGVLLASIQNNRRRVTFKLIHTDCQSILRSN